MLLDRKTTALLLFLWIGPFAQGSGAQSPVVSPPSTAADPLAVGRAEMQHGDFTAAKTFFAKYVAETPADAEAWFFLGGANLNLNNPKEAAVAFQHSVELKPDAWTAQQNLALAYAESESWSDFDKVRATLKAARAANKPGLASDGHDLIDVLRVKGKTYQVWFFPKLYGKFNSRYVVLHFDEKGKADEYIQCESDDVDQAFFAQKHPKEAKAGERSFSLDSYSVSDKGMSQALIKFYPDGEPTYETVRTDALKVLEGKSAPAATSSVPAKK